jgi:hypothetical protein
MTQGSEYFPFYMVKRKRPGNFPSLDLATPFFTKYKLQLGMMVKIILQIQAFKLE